MKTIEQTFCVSFPLSELSPALNKWEKQININTQRQQQQRHRVNCFISMINSYQLKTEPCEAETRKKTLFGAKEKAKLCRLQNRLTFFFGEKRRTMRAWAVRVRHWNQLVWRHFSGIMRGWRWCKTTLFPLFVYETFSRWKVQVFFFRFSRERRFLIKWK